MTEPLIEWNDELSVGIHEIDQQHHMLVDILNEFHDAIQQHKGTDVASAILERLADYTRIHFAVEESIMRLLAYPDYRAHKALHDELIEQLMELAVKFAAGKKSVNFELLHFLRIWLTRHIQEDDMAYRDHFLRHGVVAKADEEQKVDAEDGFSIKKMWSKLWG